MAAAAEVLQRDVLRVGAATTHEGHGRGKSNERIEMNLKNMTLELLMKEFDRLRGIDREIGEDRARLERRQSANNVEIELIQREIRKRYAAIELSADAK